MPVEVPAVIVQKQCLSAMQAVMFGRQQIRCWDFSGNRSCRWRKVDEFCPHVLPAARWGARLQTT